MKKPYTLDLEIYLASDRCEAVTEILDNLEYYPTNTELESMANYILYGKDQNALSSVDRREVTIPKKFRNYLKKDDRIDSIETIIEEAEDASRIEYQMQPLTKNVYRVIKPSIKRPTYDEEGNMIDLGDSDIPGMVELWERIDAMQRRYDMYTGKIPPTIEIRSNPATSYQKYLMRHTLIEIKRTQYFLKDAYRPTMFGGFHISSPGDIDYSVDTGLWLTPAEWSARYRNPKPHDEPQPRIEQVRRKQMPDGTERWFWRISYNEIDYKNPAHISCLLFNYKKLLQSSYERINSNIRAVLWDVERLVEEANLTELEQFVLENMVAHHPYHMIFLELREFGYERSIGQITTLCRRVIPEKLAAAAARLEDESDMIRGKIQKLQCSGCGRVFPKTTNFFARSKAKSTGFCSQCKECQKHRREARLSASMPKV